MKLEDILAVVELPECPVAVCHCELEVRQVSVFGRFSPANYPYPLPTQIPTPTLAWLYLSVLLNANSVGNLHYSSKSRVGLCYSIVQLLQLSTDSSVSPTRMKAHRGQEFLSLLF